VNKKIIFLNLALLLITPWVLTLLIARPPLRSLPATKSRSQQISQNLSFFTSPEFLFFSGDGRPDYGINGNGVFLFSFLPLIIIGLFQSRRWLLWWLLGGLIISTTITNTPGLPASLLFLPAMSILAALGFTKLFTKLTVFKTLYLAFIIYQALGLYHLILVHQPFSL